MLGPSNWCSAEVLGAEFSIYMIGSRGARKIVFLLLSRYHRMITHELYTQRVISSGLRVVLS